MQPANKHGYHTVEGSCFEEMKDFKYLRSWVRNTDQDTSRSEIDGYGNSSCPENQNEELYGDIPQII